MITKARWSKVYESSEEELQELLQAMGLDEAAERWALEAFATQDSITTEQPVQLWCAEGSCTITSHGTNLSVQPGDSLRIPVGTDYQVLAGISGCACYQV